MGITTPPPAALVAGAALLQLAIPARPDSRARSVGAGLLGLCSAALLGAAVHDFRSNGTTVNPLSPEQASSLVTTGPNRFSRNPMYVAMAGLLAAHALFRGRWAALLPAAALVTVIDRVQIPAEESALRERFASSYDAYARRVPRWLGIPSPNAD